MKPSLESLSHPPPHAAPRRRVPAWAVPALLLAGFALLFLALFRDRLLPAPSHEVAPVLATAGETAAHAAAPVTASGPSFQASGWIEPDPFPIRATALVDGVIDTVHVVEGQLVSEGDLLATLVEDDTRLALSAAVENHRTLVAARDAHLGAIETARKKHEAALAKSLAVKTLEDEAADQHARLSGLKPGTVPAADVVSARLRLERTQQERGAAEADHAATAAEIARLETETAMRDAGIAAAAVAVDQAKLAHARTRIVSPIDGRVLRLMAAPGQKKMLGADDPDSATVAILYQPDRLQVRVDVALADAAGLSVGQAARIHSGLLPDRVFTGEVTRIVGEADIQRNTLQAKVRIVDPADELRPEMLSRVEFSGAPVTSGGADGGSGPLSLWVPASAITDGAAWICDPESRRVARRTVSATGDKRDGYIRVTEGLRPGELVILAPNNLREGRRVHPILRQP